MNHRKKQILTLLCGLLLFLAACTPAATTVASVEPAAEEPATAVPAAPAAAPTDTKVVPAPTEPPTATPEPVEITWLVWSDLQSVISIAQDVIVPEFEAQYPSIKVNLIIAFSDYRIMFDGLLADGTPPDIFSTGWTGRFRDVAERDLLLDMTPYIESEGYDTADFMPSTLDLQTMDGKIMGLPYIAFGNYIYYNKDLFDQAGIAYPPSNWEDTSWTWDAFAADCQALTNVSGSMFGASFGFLYPWESLAALWGEDIYPATAYETGFAETAALDNPQVFEAVQAYQDLMHSSKCIPNVMQYNQIWMSGHPFVTQKAAMWLTDSWDMYIFRDITDFKWGIAALPYGDAGRLGMIQTDSWAISKGSAHPEEAWTLLKYIVSPEVLAQFSQQTGLAPSRISALEGWYQTFASFDPEKLKETHLGSFTYGRKNPGEALVGYLTIGAKLDSLFYMPILLNKKKAADALPEANAALIETLKKIKADYGK